MRFLTFLPDVEMRTNISDKAGCLLYRTENIYTPGGRVLPRLRLESWNQARIGLAQSSKGSRFLRAIPVQNHQTGSSGWRHIAG